jgi:hypothetical protein
MENNTTCKKCPGCKKSLAMERFIEEDREYAKCHTCRLKLVSKKNICETCGIRASFHYSGNNFGIRCSKHKEIDMIDVINKNCHKCQKKQPNYNYEGLTKAIFCEDCKEPEMVNVISKKCEKCQKKQPNYNYGGLSKGKYCFDCKESDMIDVLHKSCEKCKKKRPTFNYKGQLEPKYCINCKEAEMVNVISKKCEKCKQKLPTFNYDGQLKAIFCGDCKESDMIDVINKRCSKCQNKQPVFNYKGNVIAKYCIDCKEPDMVDIKNKKCEKCKKKQPNYNYNVESKGKYCKDCKEPEMVDVRHKPCQKCKKKRPNFNYEGQTEGKYCFNCKEPDMIDVKNKKCKECTIRAIFALPGMSPSHCVKHKTEGMMAQSRRRCQGNEEEECKENATHGIKYPIHCENHALSDEYCLAEIKCPKCGNIDILNKQGLCVTICSLEEQDKLMKKRVKKHEEFIGKLLEQEIDIKSSVIEIWRDSIIDSNCTLERPDFAYHCGSHIVVVEVDENQHTSYTNCGNTKEEKMNAENRRMYRISSNFQGTPIVFLRYNPDGFKDKDGKKGNIPNKKRHDILIRWVKKCIRTKWSDGIHVKYLFYDGYIETNSDFKQIKECDIL